MTSTTKARKPHPSQRYTVHVIYPDGTFEDRYIDAADEAEAVELVEADTPVRLRRWTRFVI